jgi:hypothetical protein
MKPDDRWTNPPPNSIYVLFDKTDPARSAQPYYLVAWLPTLFADVAVVLPRGWGRTSVSQRVRRGIIRRWWWPGRRCGR